MSNSTISYCFMKNAKFDEGTGKPGSCGIRANHCADLGETCSQSGVKGFMIKLLLCVLTSQRNFHTL